VATRIQRITSKYSKERGLARRRFFATSIPRITRRGRIPRIQKIPRITRRGRIPRIQRIPRITKIEQEEELGNEKILCHKCSKDSQE